MFEMPLVEAIAPDCDDPCTPAVDLTMVRSDESRQRHNQQKARRTRQL